MHKKVEAKLNDLARTLLALNKDTDIGLLKNNAQQIYENLCVLEHLKHTENLAKTSSNKPKIEPPTAEAETLFSIEDEIGITSGLEDIFIKKEASVSPKIKTETQTTKASATLKEKIEAAKQEESQALKNDLNLAEETSTKDQNAQSKPKVSLNDSLLQKGFSIDLNDRIAFVKHLFEDSQEDFNRVLSQLNTFETEQAAKDFIINQVKPDYSWQEKETYEERLLWLIERKFI